ncbi:protein kinase [Diaporthe helianthi]|uniref:Protein kinase n=1 Tax=Diaporthe helianthi TaxID=158607 RepID=A0A2P5I4Z6_DIAHE|nr:protein kinase [Diaporthe helianthi]
MEEEVTVRAHSPDLFLKHEAGRLQDELFSALIPTHHGERGFFAKDHLFDILTEERGAKGQDGSSSCGGQSKTKSFVKVLAILVIIEKTSSILKLLEEDVNDSTLPLSKAARSNGEKLYDLRDGKRPNMTLRCFENWNQLNIRNFEEWQWTTLPVDFVGAAENEDVDVKHLSLQDQEILPFIKDGRDSELQYSRRTEFEGGFASVFRVAIHSQHHNFHSSSDERDQAFFAVKSLHSQSQTAFAREVEILKKFSVKKHDHLINLLATYEKMGRFFLVFNWAEADLQEYWKSVNPVPQFDLSTVHWMAMQCKGIAHGIIKIHEHKSMYAKQGGNGTGNKNVVFGHHGDIKPENVLWFADSSQSDKAKGGTLKLSDFGLAEFSIHQTTSMPPKKNLGVSLAYRAPEADLQQGKAMGRSYDIWTLGCLYLEFITWMLGGSKLLNEFLEARKNHDVMWHEIETHTFFKLEIDAETRKPTAVIKPAVKKFIRRLHSHQNCSQVIHDFLDMIEKNILVVKTNRPQEAERFEIKQVHQALIPMLERCEKSAEYAISPVPWLFRT